MGYLKVQVSLKLVRLDLLEASLLNQMKAILLVYPELQFLMILAPPGKFMQLMTSLDMAHFLRLLRGTSVRDHGEMIPLYLRNKRITSSQADFIFMIQLV
jgi:hypothetical protein